jgi:hypothetical protein
LEFGNGFAASVIQGSTAYYEVAVLNSDGYLDYRTPVTSDVIAYLTQSGVEDVLVAIEALPAAS